MAFLLLVGVVIKFVGMHADIEMENDSNKKRANPFANHLSDKITT